MCVLCTGHTHVQAHTPSSIITTQCRTVIHIAQVVREGLIAANSYVGAHAGAQRHSSAVLAAPIVRHLQQQAAGLSRALVLLASEVEADAARLALVEVSVHGRRSSACEAVPRLPRVVLFGCSW